MNIKLVAVDIDGTLLNSQSQISERDRRAIRAAVDRGVRIILVTGRRFVIARPIALELALTTPLITHNGALVKHPQTGAVIDYHPLAASLARRVVALGRSVGADLVCCCDPEGLGQAIIERISEHNVRLRRYLDRAPLVVEQVPDLMAAIRRDPIQIMSSGPCAQMDAFERVLADELNGRVTLLKTAYPQKDMTILDILAPRCSKAVALARLVARYRLNRQQVMAIGDNENDVAMLQYAGLGVMMGNAQHHLKSAADYVTTSNDEAGVARAIERFILQG